MFHTAFNAFRDTGKPKIHRTDLPNAPNFWKDVSGHQHEAGFRVAMDTEYYDLERRGTFETVPTSSAGKAFIIPVRWVYTYKFDKNGYLTKYKARLVVRGDLQRHSIHEETYAATLAARTFRALCAIANHFDLEMYQYDAVNAFTNSNIDEEIFVRCPEGYLKEGHCLKLIKALYGLR